MSSGHGASGLPQGEQLGSWSGIALRRSSIPTILCDVTDINKKCNELEQLEILDIDRYISAELLLKKYSLLALKIEFVNDSAVSAFRAKNRFEMLSKKSYLFNVFLNKITQVIVNNLINKEYKYELNCDVIDLKFNKLYFKVYVDLFEEGVKKYVLISVMDITSSKNFEMISTEFIEKYYLLLRSINEAILIVDVESGIVLEANTIAIELFKSAINTIIGANHFDFFDHSERQQYEEFFQRSVKNKASDEPLDIFISQYDREKTPVQIEINTATVGSRRVAQIILYNMSNRFKMEEGRRLLAIAVDQAAESVIITDIHGNIEYVNPAFEDISGYSYTEVLGKNPRFLRSGETPSYQYKLMWEEISQGNVWRGTFTNRKKDGTIYKEEATITPVKDNKGHIVNYVAVKRDITQHLILENQIRQSQKMQAIGTLAGGVAHDFNNILTAILGYAELSQAQCSPESLLYKNLEEIVRAADRAGKLVDQILQFSRQGEKSVSSLKISLIINEVLKLLRASLPANVELVADITREVFVKADPTQMHQIIMNLCTNAYQALEGKGGTIWIRLFTRTLSPREGVVIGRLQPGNYVCLQVEDNGVGIPPEYLQRIFEPYFTSRKLHEGTGLGLSVVHGIVNDHRGTVTVESTVGVGSCFTVYLPESDEQEQGTLVQSGIANLARQGTILVVDDEQPITVFLTQVLEHLGYTVKACLSSEEAYTMFCTHQGVFDLVITDMGMPGMTGMELARKVQLIQPDIPVILCTGFSEQVTTDNYQQMGLAGFVAKPFSAESLSREVDRILFKGKVALPSLSEPLAQ
jgi:PAS domain S-box-containing protein